MSVLKRKSSIALITGIIIMLLLIPLWYVMLVPSIIASEMEKIDTTTTYEGIIAGQAVFDLTKRVRELPIRIEAHVYVKEVKGDNIVLKVEATFINITDPDKPNEIEEFSDSFGNSTYVINKFTRKNVPDATDADKNRTGYDPIYPPHLKAGEDIPNVWLDVINKTSTLEFKGSVVEDGVTLYEYSAYENFTKKMKLEPFIGEPNFTLIYTKTVLVEPLSGLPTYTKNETFIFYLTAEGGGVPRLAALKLVYPLTYNSTAEAKDQGLAEAKTMYSGMQLLELYIPTILGVIVIILVIGFAFNIRRLKRKVAP